jgi:hypoxanthine phosphoribosyltransferase
MTKPELDFSDLTRRLKALELPPADLVVGIATGGTVPASLVAFHLDLPLALISINFRDPANQPQRAAPELLAPFSVPATGQRILLVDDVSVTGRTLEVARAQLTGYSVTTLVFKGKADFVLLPEISSCVIWPWNRHGQAVTS